MLYPQFPEYHLRQLAADTERNLERNRRNRLAREAKKRVRRPRTDLG